MIRSTRKVRKRDGREVPFDQAKISDAIYRAAQSVGGGDPLLSEELASVVSMFIDKEWGERTPSIDDVSDLIEKVLVETGHTRTAKAYILERDRRARIRSALRVRHEDRDGRERLPRVDARNRATVGPWSKGKIVEALIVEAELEPQVAEEIAAEVERRIFSSGLTRVSTTMVRALVDNELFERGYERLLNRQQMIGMPRYDVDRMARSGVAEGEADGVGPDASIIRSTWTQYSLDEIFPDDVVEAHLVGAIHVGGLGAPSRFQGLSFDLGATLENNAELDGVQPLDRLRLTLDGAKDLVEDDIELGGLDSFILNARTTGEVDPERVARDLVVACSRASCDNGGPRVDLRVPVRPSKDASRVLGEDGLQFRARMLSELIRHGSLLGERLQTPRLVLDVSGAAATDEVLLEQAVLAEAGPGHVVIVADTAIGGRLARVAPVPLRVDVNVARVAFRAPRFDTKAVVALLNTAIETAVAACEARASWLRALPGRASPRDRLRRSVGGGSLAVGAGRYEIGIAGLDAACRIAFDHSLWRDDRAREFARAILAAARASTTRLAKEYRLPLALRFSVDPIVLGRLGTADFERHPRGRDLHGLRHDGRRYQYGCSYGAEEREPEPANCAAIEAALRRDLIPTPLPVHHALAPDRVRFLRKFADHLRGNAAECS